MKILKLPYHLLHWTFVLCFFVFSGQLLAQKATAELNRDQIKIGEQITLSLTLQVPQGAQINWPQLPDTLTQTVEIVERSGIDTLTDGFHQNLIITSFDSGYHAIAPITFQVNGQMVQTEPMLIAVQTVQVDSSNAIADIKTIKDVEVSYFEIFKEWLGRNWPYVVGALAALILIIAFFIWWKKRKVEVVEGPPPPPRPAHEIALEKLGALEEKQLWQHDKIKLHYIELTEVLREYLENRYRIHALELTTDEIMQNLRVTDIPKETKEHLGQLLRLSDLVKFAKHQPLPSENNTSLTDARRFVEITLLIEKAEESAAEPTQTTAS